MKLSEEQNRFYRDRGYLLLPNVFTAPEVALLQKTLPRLFERNSPDRVLEKGSSVVRAVHGCHLNDPVCARLARLPSLVEPARQLLGGDVYVYQFKINAKAALLGDIWEWHQDYIFWNKEDGLPRPEVVNVAVFVDEVNEINGPMILLEGSHREGMIDTGSKRGTPQGYEESPEWISNLTADLKYSFDRELLAKLMEVYPPKVPKGPAGSLLLFHPNVVHGSAQNMFPVDRRIVLVSYCHVANRPRTEGERRPEFLVSRDFSPVTPLAGGLAA